MKNLLQTHSISWAQSVRIALEAEGIETLVLDEQSLGYLGFAGRVRVAIVDDDDLPRARRVLARLEFPRGETPPSWHWHKRALMAFGVGFALLLVLPGTAASAPRTVTLVVLGAGAAAFILGFILLILGYRADSKELP